MKLKDLNRMSSHTTVNWESRHWKLAWLGLFFICTLMTLMFLFMYIFYVYLSHSWALSGAPRCQLVTDDHRKCTRPTSTMCYALCSIQYTVQYALNTKHLNYVLCTEHYALELCTMFYALCTRHPTRDPPRPPPTWCIAKGGPTTPSWPQLWKFCGCCLNCEGSQNDKENYNCADEFEEWSLIHGAFFSLLDLTKWHRPVRSHWHVLFQFIPGPSPAQNSQHS